MAKQATPRPFLKWAGGKTQLVKELLARAPESFNHYHEPFVGGGALFFGLCREGRIGNATISDLNQELIQTYIAVRDQVDAVIELLDSYEHEKDFFYRLRAKLPTDLEPAHVAARMIYLNKTCYNGLYRVNRRGEFNVPFGSYKSPRYHDPENLHAVSAALQKVTIKQSPFDHVLKRARAGDFVYFDPPYQPLSTTASFTAYQPDGFGEASQRRLAEVFARLADRGVHVMLSNSATELIRQLYEPQGFRIDKVKAIRAINSNPKRRGKLWEFIVRNSDVEKRAGKKAGARP